MARKYEMTERLKLRVHGFADSGGRGLSVEQVRAGTGDERAQRVKRLAVLLAFSSQFCGRWDAVETTADLSALLLQKLSFLLLRPLLHLLGHILILRRHFELMFSFLPIEFGFLQRETKPSTRRLLALDFHPVALCDESLPKRLHRSLR